MIERRLRLFFVAVAAIGSCSPRSPPASTDGAVAACAPPPMGLDTVLQWMQKKQGTMGTASVAMVVSSHARATEIGVSTLARGGNAVDAFIATVLAEDLVLPGVTSTAGLAGFLVYKADTKEIYYVHGPLKAVASPGGTGIGGQVLLPGAISALAFASQKYGHLPLADVIAPVVALARDGFPIDALYAWSIAHTKDILLQSPYGQKTFFQNGLPLSKGAVLALPDVATTLLAFGALGPDYFYRGDWASQFVAAVNGAGGRATLADLESYQPLLVAPLTAQYRGFEIQTSSGYSSGGARLLLALKVLEHADLQTLGRFDQSAASLEMLARIHDAESTQTWLQDPTVLSQPSDAEARIASGSESIWKMVQTGKVPPAIQDGGSHSSAVIAVDAAGNIVVGTHSINTTNWGSRSLCWRPSACDRCESASRAHPGSIRYRSSHIRDRLRQSRASRRAQHLRHRPSPWRRAGAHPCARFWPITRRRRADSAPWILCVFTRNHGRHNAVLP